MILAPSVAVDSDADDVEPADDEPDAELPLFGVGLSVTSCIMWRTSPTIELVVPVVNI